MRVKVLMTTRVKCPCVLCLCRLTIEVDDPFEKHFASPNEIRLSQCIQEIKMERWGTEVGLIERLWHRKIKQPSTQTLYPVILAGTNITKGLQSMNVRMPFLNSHVRCF